MFTEKGALRDFTKFKEKHLCRSLFLIKLQAFKPDNCHKEMLVIIAFIVLVQIFFKSERFN